MKENADEEQLLREVTLQSATSIFLARQRAEEELVRTKEALELKAQELAHSLAMMRATLESTTDGILVTDSGGRVTDFNRKYADMWRLPPEIVESREHQHLLEVCGGQLGDPSSFLARVEEIYAASPPESYDLLKLADGRVFERFSRVQHIEGRNVGRVWSFRDVTERQRAEEALRERVHLSALRAEIAGALAESQDLQPILQRCADLLVRHLEVAFARIWTLNDAEGVLELQASAGMYTHRDGPHSRIKIGQFKIGWIAQERRPHLTNDVPVDPRVSDPEWARREGMVAFAGYPLLVESRCVGVLAMFSRLPLTQGMLADLAPLADGIAQCIERKRAEEALRKQAEWWRVTLSSVGDAVITTDVEGRVTSLNPVAEVLTGWSQQEAEGVPLERVFCIVNQESRQPVESPVIRSLREGRIVGLANHTVLIARNGPERAIDDSAAPIRDEQGQIMGVVMIFRDVTRERQAQQTTEFLANASAALTELTDYESTLQKIAALAVPFFADWCAVDMREGDGSVRRLAFTHTDPTRVQLAHELFRRYPPRPDDPHGTMKVLRTGEPEWVAAISDSLLEEAALDEEHMRMMRALGLKSYLCVPLKSRGQTLGALTFVTAESGRVYDADGLRAAEDLAHRAVIAIENATLLGVLRESDRRKDEFLAILAHELRNPLAPIRNAAQILRAKSPPIPELQWAREVIDRQVEQMTRLVDDLLDVSRITRGKIELRKERVELGAVVQDAVEASRPLIDERGHTLKVEVPSEPVVLEADATRLAQVVLNLLNNAAKYTDPGGHIWLTAERQGGQVMVRVKDTGVGIHADMLPRIFDMFTQVDRSLERAQGGLGIGLTLVQRLVAMHGGAVEAHSPGPGSGSEFVVRLPVADEARDSGAQRAAPENERMAAAAGCRILVVDDNRDAADSLAILLEMIGHEVRIAGDGLEAVGVAEEFEPNVILLDIGLPKLNGYQVAGRIREQRRGAVVLIALTGWGQEEDRRRSTEAGFDHHMTKPVELDALSKLLADLNPHTP